MIVHMTDAQANPNPNLLTREENRSREIPLKIDRVASNNQEEFVGPVNISQAAAYQRTKTQVAVIAAMRG